MEERLRRFAVIVDAGSFTKAAALLHTSQPALSVAVQKLERELKATLIEHKGRGFTLTAEGYLAYESGRRILQESRRLRTALDERSQGRPVLRIGAIDHIAELLFVAHDELDALEEAADVSLSVNNSTSLLQATQAGELNVALIVSQPSYAPELMVHDLGTEELVAVCAPSIQMHVARRLNQGYLAHFMSYNRGSTTFRLVSSYLEGLSITPEPLFYSTSPTIMLELSLRAKGSAVLPRQMVNSYLRTGRLVELKLSPTRPLRPIVAVYQKDSVVPEPLESFLASASRIIMEQ